MKEASIKIWKDGYVDMYPEFSKLADDQIKIFWPWNEINVAKDKQDLLVGMTEAEKHGTISTLKLFTKYELFVGSEHWGSRIAKAYPHVGIQRMSAAFAHVELNSHAPFYNEINKELGLANYEFYTSYLDDPTLSSRMKFIEEVIESKDDELSTAVFSIVEGAVLYSAFAFLKHFQSQGKNKVQNINRGINMSARDENLHAIGGSGIVRVALKEQERTDQELKEFSQAVKEAADQIYLHECQIIDKIFEHGKIEGVTDLQLKRFVQSRINLCLDYLGVDRNYIVEYNPISDWFYKGINDYQMNDFFQGVGREYQRDWVKNRFVWKKD
jgi:ribonucleotide reductase beta subunit family protein with ferritin-like domain